MNLVDSHAHLEFDDYTDDISHVLGRAHDSSVRSILSVSCINGENDGGELVSLVKEHSGSPVTINSAFGVHPHDAICWNPQVSGRIRELCSLNHCVALGEIGFDFYYKHSPVDIQDRVFREQIELALELELPIIVHSRDADEKTLEVLKSYYQGDPLPRPGVVHCFTGTLETAGKILELGFYISFGGMVTFKKADEIRDVVRYVPLESLLIETDSPFLAPVPFRGKRNEPAHVSFVAEKIAQLKQVSLEEAASVTTSNYNQLFSQNIPVGF